MSVKRYFPKDTEQPAQDQETPRWSWRTKLVVGLALTALAVWLLVQFQNFLGPIISSVILTYLLYPIADFLQKKIKIPWRISVTLIFIVLVLILAGLLTWGGLALFDQIQNLIRFFENNIDQLPELVSGITTQTYQIGPFTFTLSGLNWDEITNQIVGVIQPLLGRVGSFASSIATGAVNIISWFLLILLVAYFLLAESEGIPSKLLNIKIPGYTKDLERMGDELNRIWNAFMRGEIFVVFISLVIYTFMLGVLGLQFFFGLAVIAAVGQLIPYIGAWATWISFGLVALFQTNIPFNMPPGIYMIIVLGISLIINNIIDNIIRTKVMAENLRVHPAVVLLGALICVQIFGFIGIVVAAPIMASLKLILNYVIKKLSDQDPWQDFNIETLTEKSKTMEKAEEILQQVWHWLQSQTSSLLEKKIKPFWGKIFSRKNSNK